MAQTVFDAGDPITSRLKLGQAPDGTTNVTVSVRRPDGTALTGLIISAFGGTDLDEKTVQWYATNDGAAGSPTTAAAGDWLAVWTVTGKGASVSPKVYSVYPLPGTATNPTWMPFMREVGDYIPWLTLDTAIPGGDTFLGTFTGTTYPTDEQAVRHVERVIRPITERWPTLPTTVYELARSYVTLRSAASLARAFPREAGGTIGQGAQSAADALDRQADALWAALVKTADDAQAEGTNPTGTGNVPVWAFPTPVAFGDDYL
jgi:hypothetical protein